jgi:putative peptidoglycan lipid II flippase
LDTGHLNKNKRNSAIMFSSLKMAVATFSSRILGLVRELVMAAVFGATGVTDAFLVAYRIPNMLRDLFAEGAFSAAFVPIFTEVRQKNLEESKSLLWSLFVLLGLVTLTISFLIMIFAPELTHLMAPSFDQNPEQFNLTVTLVRIMAPFLFLVSIAALFMGVLNSLRVFFIPSFAPVFFNVVMILSTLFLPQVMVKFGKHPAIALGIGVIVGGLFQLLFQVPILFKKKFNPTGPIKLISKNTKKIMNRVGIGTIGIATNQINLVITTILATSTVVGAVSWLSYAMRLFQFPIGILGVSIAGSNLVHFSDSWKAGNFEQAKKYLKTSYDLSWFVMMPATALLFALSTESIHLVLERGAFLRSDTQMASLALRLYLISLPSYGLYKIFVPTFYTLDRPTVPVMISVGTVLFNIAFCLILTPIYGFKILALGTSLSMIINSLLQSFFLRKLLKLDWNFFFEMKMAKILLASYSCFYLTRLMIGSYFHFDQHFLFKSMIFLVVAFLGTLAYAVLLLIMGEYKNLKRAISKK